MTDMLLELSRRGAARRAVQALGLPLPVPRVFERATGPWQSRELAGRAVGVVGFRRDALGDAIARVVAEQGASVTGTTLAPFQRASEAFSIPLAAADASLHALLVDATALTHVDELRGWLMELQPFVRRIRTSGRLIVLAAGDPAVPQARAAVGSMTGVPSASSQASQDLGHRDPGDAETAAVAAALEGFVRSAAKELGRRGATANLLVVDRGAEQRAASIARFFLSPRSAFITAQPVRASLLAASTPSQTSMAPNPPMISMRDPVRALDCKVALVTGAGRGIGEATARRLAEEGAHVICVDRPADEPAVAAVARSIGGSVVLADVAAPDTPAALVQHVRERHGHLDVLVHNAGITRDRTFAKMSEAEWNAVIDINLRAVIEITRAFLSSGGAVLRGGGRVICLSSVSGIAGNAGQTNYAASKAGLIGYVRALASDLAPRGITVNAIAPGFIETRMTAAIPFTIREAGRRLSALGQGGLPVDVAEAVTFLAQPAAVGITGAVLRVCGGALIGA